MSRCTTAGLLRPLLPHAGGQAAEEEGDVALDEGREEGEHAVDGEGDEKGLTSADPVGQAAPHEGPDHHPQVHDQAWRQEGEGYKATEELVDKRVTAGQRDGER